MSIFHVNKETGDVGTCRATKGKCPFGGPKEHFTSAMAASLYFEQLQASAPKFSAVRTDDSGIVYEFPENRLELAKEAIARANRRLENLGLKERFTYEVEEFFSSPSNNGVIATVEPMVRFSLNTPSVQFEGYHFLAAVEKADAGFVVKSATGVNLAGYSPDNLRCDSCGKLISRQKTYLIEDSDGNIIQVGSSCVKNYFGVEPKGLWALSFDPFEKLSHDSRWTSLGPSAGAVPTVELMAYALAVSDGGENYVSRNSSYEYGGLSSADRVKDVIFGARDREYSVDMQKKAQEYLRNGEADRLVQKLKESDQSTDYGRNMAVLASGEWTKPGHINLLVSGLTQLAREKREQRKASHDARWGTVNPGFAGEVGESLKGRKFKVYSVTHRLMDDHYGREIETSRVVFRDEANHEVIWWASKSVELDEGTEVTVKSGSVKKHGQYNGKDQTVVTRVRLEES